MDLTSSSTNWIYAYKVGSALNSDSVSTSIDPHDGHGTFTLDLNAATGGDGTVNPFTGKTTWASNTSTNSSLSSDNSTTSTDITPQEVQVEQGTLAHGIMGAVAFVFLFPSGSMVMRVFNFKHVLWVHVGLQIIGYLVALTVMETGVWIAVNNGEVCPIILVNNLDFVPIEN